MVQRRINNKCFRVVTSPKEDKNPRVFIFGALPSKFILLSNRIAKLRKVNFDGSSLVEK